MQKQITILDGTMFESGLESKTFWINHDEGTDVYSYETLKKYIDPSIMSLIEAKINSKPDVRYFPLSYYEIVVGSIQWLEVCWD